MDNNLVLFKKLERKFSVFRWGLIFFMYPSTVYLSYNRNIFYFILLLLLIIMYNTFVTIAAYSKKNNFIFILRWTKYVDTALISLLLIISGGLRSDVYLLYYLIILYDGAKFGLKGTINCLVQSIIFFTIATFFFTDELYFEFNRYIIRVIYLTIYVFVINEVNHQIAESRAKEKIARELAEKDPLTQLPNRLLMSDYFEKMRNNSEVTKKFFTIALFDIDNFKPVNDCNGHAFGDKVILELANILNKNISNKDFICRFGGDEFLAFLAISEKDKAINEIKKIQQQIASHNFEGFSLTISVGIKMYSHIGTMIENIIWADVALYAAKNSGKNQVIAYDDMENKN